MINLSFHVVIFFLVLDGHIFSSASNMHCKKELVRDYLSEIKPEEYMDSNPDSKDQPKDMYDLKVTNSGPAVLDSVIFFKAIIEAEKGQLGDIKRFIYIWSNDADDDMYSQTTNDFNSSLSRSFSSMAPKIYKMKVCVYDQLPRIHGFNIKHVRVAQGLTEFHVTENLNGKLQSHQELPNLSKENVYETNDTVNVNVNLTDKFTTERIFDFLWIFKFGNEELRIPTKTPNVTYESSSVGKHTVELVVTSYIIQPGLTEPTEFGLIKGKFIKEFILKDKVSSTGISVDNGQDVVPVGENITLNVTYEGSNPTIICWSIIDEDENSTVVDNETCSRPIIGQSHSYKFSVELEHTGKQYINVSIENDVSEVLQMKVLYVYNPNTSGSLSVAVPVVFSILGICVVIIGIAYVVRLKRKPEIEVADFDFHPSLHHGETHPFIRAIKYKFYVMFSRNTYAANHDHPSFKTSTARTYGSVHSSSELEFL